MAGAFILKLDVRKFFDTMDHGHLREILRRRVRDGVLLRLIGKWLKAGVLEDGHIAYPTSGSPQGGVVSPILANIYMHEVLDTWFVRDVLPRMRRKAFLVRYADDAIMVFAAETDARRVLAVLPKRFEKFGLSLHPEKTQLVDFRRPDRFPNRDGDPKGGPGTFDHLGFTFFWAKSRKGKWVVYRKTARDRLNNALNRISLWCRRNRHLPLSEQHKALSQKLKGHYGYYGVIMNSRSLSRFYGGVLRLWRKWLSRRSDQGLSRERMARILKRFRLPPPRIVHRPVFT